MFIAQWLQPSQTDGISWLEIRLLETLSTVDTKYPGSRPTSCQLPKIIAYFRRLDLQIGAPDADESPELLAMVEGMKNQGLNMIDIETGYTWRPTINFAPVFS